MIQALLEYAETRGLASRPGYRKKQIKWVLQFDASGRTLTGVVPSDKEFDVAPDLSFSELRALGAREGEAAHFLVAPLGTWLAWAKDEADEAKELKRRATLVGMLQEAARACPALKDLAQSLLDPQNRTAAMQFIESHKPAPKPTDLATVMLGGDFPVEDDRWHAWWDTFRAGLVDGGKAKGLMVSFASGDLIEPETTHPKLTKLSGVGLSQPFAPIITFDKPAFESYGQSQGANAAMDAEASKAYVTALDDLLERSVVYSWKRPKPKEPKQLEKEFAKLGGARILYWYSGPAEARQLVEDDLDVAGLGLGSIPPRAEPPEDDAAERLLVEARLREAIRQVKTGETAVPVGEVQFHMIALSGAGGRVMTRDYVQSSLLALTEAAERWFDHLSLITYAGEPSRHPKLEQILTCALRPKGDQDYLKWVTPVGAWRQQMWRAALLGSAIPESAPAKALLAFNSTVVSGDLTDSEKGPRARSLGRLRLALVKAHLIRNRGIPMQPALDPEHPSPAYHCGRLLAVYDSVQRIALGDVGAGVVQRNYGGAIVNPSGVLGRLSTLVTKHLDKIGGGLENTYENKIAEIHNGIKEAYPSALDQEGQALFALGFWHQIAADNAEKVKNSAAKKARESAQDALLEEEDINEQ